MHRKSRLPLVACLAVISVVAWSSCRLDHHAAVASAQRHNNGLLARSSALYVDNVRPLPLLSDVTLKKHTVIHVTHRGGGTERAVRDLISLFPEHSHVVTDCHNASAVVDAAAAVPGSCTKTLHLHSCIVNGTSWDATNIVNAAKRHRARVIMTVHDYQWVSPLKPNPPQHELRRNALGTQQISIANRLMTSCDIVIFPTRSVHSNYARILGWRTMLHVPSVIIPHPDYPAHYNAEAWPPIVNGVCNVAFVGDFLDIKGSRTFVSLVQDVHELTSRRGPCFTLRFNVFGYVDPSNDFGLTDALGDASSLFWSNRHAAGSDLVQQLHSHRTHVVLLLSTVPETYSYTLTHCINSGLPILYMDQGALAERLRGRGRRFFKTNKQDVVKTLARALMFVARTNPTGKTWERGEGVYMESWYRDVYDICGLLTKKKPCKLCKS